MQTFVAFVTHLYQKFPTSCLGLFSSAFPSAFTTGRRWFLYFIKNIRIFWSLHTCDLSLRESHRTYLIKKSHQVFHKCTNPPATFQQHFILSNNNDYYYNHLRYSHRLPENWISHKSFWQIIISNWQAILWVAILWPSWEYLSVINVSQVQFSDW